MRKKSKKCFQWIAGLVLGSYQSVNLKTLYESNYSQIAIFKMLGMENMYQFFIAGETRQVTPDANPTLLKAA